MWDLLDAGAKNEAYVLFEHLLPSLMLEGMLGMAYAKEIMVRRGIFKNHNVRSRTKPLDDCDMAAIARTWERIQPYLVWGKK